MRHTLFLALGLALVLASACAHAQTTPPVQSVQAAISGSLIKIDGRLFAGVFYSEVDGAYPNRSLDIPDAKLRFTFTPSKHISVVNRFSNNKGNSNGLDYLYLDVKDWGGVLPGHTLRAGKIKIDVGEETWADNPVENILITNSAAAVSGYDEGINFRGPLPVARPATYSVAVMNASRGVGVSANGLAVSAKVGGSPIDNFYLSASYYSTGSLVNANDTLASTDLRIANLSDAPAGATSWERNLYQVDARWHYGPTGVRSVTGSAPNARYQLGAAYGCFSDDAVGAPSRKGDFWYVEGLYNATDRIYLASRYSSVGLDDGMTAKLVNSPVAVNEYTRLSLGVGYRLTPLTHLKAEYTINSTDGGATEPELNQIAVGIATKF